MSNKLLKFLLICTVVLFSVPAISADAEDLSAIMDDVGAVAVAEYNLEESMFQRIADLEQEKVLMQLEKERAQLELDLDRLSAEKIKLQIEVDAISGRAEEQTGRIAAEQQRLENERAALEAQRQKIAQGGTIAPTDVYVAAKPNAGLGAISEKYKLVEIIGAGRQLQATLEDLANGQKKKVWAGKSIDGYEVRSVSIDDGIVFSKDGELELLNVEIGGR